MPRTSRVLLALAGQDRGNSSLMLSGHKRTFTYLLVGRSDVNNRNHVALCLANQALRETIDFPASRPLGHQPSCMNLSRLASQLARHMRVASIQPM